MYRSIKPLSTLIEAPPMQKITRSLSVSSSISSSSTSSSSSTYSRSADDLLDRLGAQEADTTITLWSAGNLRLNSLDLTMPAREANDLLDSMRNDERFEVVKVVYLDDEGDEWKISFRRTVLMPNSPVVFATE